MNWCQAHWTQLVQAVKDRGLDKLGARNAEEALDAMATELNGGEEAFDPLLGSWARINSYMSESLVKQHRGSELLQLKCPCCILVEDKQPHLVENWINGVTDSARAYALEQGLIKVS